jgi:hypothetical protein
MNSEEFKTIVEGCVANINGVLQKKSREYSSKDDKLHNFDKAKDLMRCKTKEYALWGMFAKHLVSITDMVEKYEKYGILPDKNMVEEKIGDGINYFVLLKACFLEDICNTKISAVEDIRLTCDVLKKAKANTGLYFYKNKDIGILQKEQAAIANSMYNNPRKRLVVEKLRKMLNPLFVWLTEHNRFVDYEKIKGTINKAELEADSVPDEFVKDVIVCICQLEISSIIWYQKRDEIVSQIIQVMLFPKYKIGDTVWTIMSDCKEGNWRIAYKMTVNSMFLYEHDKAVGYKGLFGDMVHEAYCFRTEQEAQAECDRRNNEQKKQEEDEKDVVNTRKVAVVENMQNKLKPIIEFVQITNPKEYGKLSEIFLKETKKHNSIGDGVFYEWIIMWLKSLPELPEIELPQYRFRTLKQIREIVVKQLEEDLKKM